MAPPPVQVAGLYLPTTNPAFLLVVGAHVLLGLISAISGLVAMLSRKGPGRHPTAGKVYFWSLGALASSSAVLGVMRWPQDVHLMLLGLLAFFAALFGRWQLHQERTRTRFRLHLCGMGASYTLMLVAFYVDNGPHLPGWRALPPVFLWLIPTVLGAGIVLRTQHTHPLTRPSADESTVRGTSSSSTSPFDHSADA